MTERRRGSRKLDEPVRLTRIYTRGGDRGETSLGDGSRVSKLDPLISASGAVDELNSVLGAARASAGGSRAISAALELVHNDLFDLGADLSVPLGEKNANRLRVTQGQIDRLERLCDELNEGLPELKSFVLPGGTEESALLHVARAVCRRAERVTLEADAARPLNPLALVYLNRLSDLLFILARRANHDAGEAEPLWKPGGAR